MAAESALRINSSNSSDDGSLEKRLSIDRKGVPVELSLPLSRTASALLRALAAEPELRWRDDISASGKEVG